MATPRTSCACSTPAGGSSPFAGTDAFAGHCPAAVLSRISVARCLCRPPHRFGPLSKSKAARLFSRPAAEAEAAMPPLARRGRQRQQQQPAASGDRGSDASPSTSSQRSGSSTQLAGGGSGSRGNHPVAMPSCQQQQQQAAIQELPGIGTWAGRYRLFGGRNPPEERQAVAVAQQQQTSPPVRSGAGQAQQCAAEQQERGGGDGDMDGSPVVLRPGGYVQPAAAAQPGEGRLRGNYGSPEAQEDAWRWRFSRCVGSCPASFLLECTQIWPGLGRPLCVARRQEAGRRCRWLRHVQNTSAAAPTPHPAGSVLSSPPTHACLQEVGYRTEAVL